MIYEEILINLVNNIIFNLVNYIIFRRYFQTICKFFCTFYFLDIKFV